VLPTQGLMSDSTSGTGAYSYIAIAAHFGIHLSTVGRVVSAPMQQSEN
jgi:transposase